MRMLSFSSSKNNNRNNNSCRNSKRHTINTIGSKARDLNCVFWIVSFLPILGVVSSFTAIPRRTNHPTRNRILATYRKQPGITLHAMGKARFITNKMCPFAQKAWIALELGQVPYSMEEISLYGSNGKPDWFWNLNPRGEVPVLVVANDSKNSEESIVLADSDLILNEMGNQIPVEVVDKASSSSSSSLVLPSLSPSNPKLAQQILTFRKVLKEFLPIGKSAVLGGSKEKMWKKLKELDRLVVGPYICGQDITIADCAAFPFVWRLDQEYGLSGRDECPNLATWISTCKAHPAFAKTIQPSWWWWW